MNSYGRFGGGVRYGFFFITLITELDVEKWSALEIGYSTLLSKTLSLQSPLNVIDQVSQRSILLYRNYLKFFLGILLTLQPVSI